MNPLLWKVVWNFAGFLSMHLLIRMHKLYLACGTKWFNDNAWFAAENKNSSEFLVKNKNGTG